MKNKKNLFIVLAITISFCIMGCSMKMGSFDTQTHFTYPNSNITPLGSVESSRSKTTFIIPPAISAEDVRGLISEALKKKPGADLIINYGVDTKLTIIPIPIFSIFMLDMTLSGTAVKMEVGRKELQEQLKKFDY